MLIDANVLVYAVHRQSPKHEPAEAWLTEQLNGPRRIGLPWTSLLAFLRISTHPRAFQHPLRPAVAWQRVSDWLEAPVAWIPQPGPRHATVLGDLIATHQPSGHLVPDTGLAALALEHGLTVISTDTDFARFTEIRWENPLA